MGSICGGRALFALTVLGIAGLSPQPGAVAAPGLYPGAETVDVYWMSGVINNGRACVGVAGLHGSNAYDLIADNSADPHCYDENTPAAVKLRTLGYSSTPHATLRAYMWSQQDSTTLCDYVEAQTVQRPTGTPRGTYRYTHALGGSGYFIDIWAGPSLLPTESQAAIGTTTHDDNCSGGWTGYHTHQNSRDGAPSVPNTGLPTDDDIPVWDPNYWIHKWTYTLPDTDSDGFQDAAEGYMGTDRLDACPDGSWDDAWPADINNDTWCDVGDILEFKPHIMCSVGDPCYDNRFDLSTDGSVDVGDILMLKPVIVTTCA